MVLKKIIISVFMILLLPCFSLYAGNNKGRQTKGQGEASAQDGQTPAFGAMPAPGQKVPIGTNHYLVYGFAQKPKLGTLIMKVEVFNNDGKKNTSMEISADAGMPSMRGAHETGDRPFALSNKGAYLLPINIVMPGVWEIRLTVKKDGKVIFRGSHQFDV